MEATELERFLSKVHKDEAGCWIWTGYGRGGSKAEGYYGGFRRDNGKTVYTHRLAFEHWIGPIPRGLEIDHLCRVRACCNPQHLEPVTRAENERRALAIRKTCVRGHPFDAANTRYTRLGHRKCRECHRTWERERRKQPA